MLTRVEAGTYSGNGVIVSRNIFRAINSGSTKAKINLRITSHTAFLIIGYRYLGYGRASYNAANDEHDSTVIYSNSVANPPFTFTAANNIVTIEAGAGYQPFTVITTQNVAVESEQN